MLIDKHTNTFFVVALLALILTVGWYSFNDYSAFIANQQELAKHSVDNTAREIELLVANRKNSVKLFAQREQKLLRQLIEHPDDVRAQSLLESRVNAYFPNRLAVTIANDKGELLLKHGKKLVGKTCRKDIQHFFTTMESPSMHVHSSPGTPKLHIDILSDTSELIRNSTVFFVSFFLDDLLRTISHGQIVGHQLTLVRTSTPELIETHSEEIIVELEKLVGPLDQIPSVKPREFRKIWSTKLNQHVLAKTTITDTEWELRSVAKTGLLQQRLNSLILQAAGVIFIFIIVTITGLQLTNRLKVSRGNTTAVLLRLEDERKRIAMDLHDQVLSDISHIQRECRLLASNDEQAEKHKNLISKNLSSISKAIRNIIDDLHPHSLSLLGFADAARAYCTTHIQSCTDIEIKLEIIDWEDNRLNDINKLHLFRILQESIDNVIKHANASQCDIRLTMDSNLLQLTVKDNGVGITIKNHDQNIGHGIANIKERCRILDAKVSWQSGKKHNGTSFVLKKELNDAKT